ncbi:ImmA/IrrE family metallo-endopeptidase [Peribacillus asahii]|uniref:ImmA/IrrE family metallo-endopeptidase n=1 Tax=Peribacillus asahii TaxID=228899 RepID=UPI00207A87D4|nr:hypothetical protein [Peribacillus asahii]USK87537.1 hypothetical protein LIT35_24115 [Peribacillus asahii]
MVDCIILDVYIGPGSDMTQEQFNRDIDWINFVYGVPNTRWGNVSPNPCGFDIRWRFRNDQGALVMAPIETDLQPNTLGCSSFENITDPNLREALSSRPTGPGPFGETNTRDIAVYYLRGPLTGGSVGCAPYITNNGPAIVITNPPTGFIRSNKTLAHELGHVLLSHTDLPNVGHVDDVNNIMFAGAPRSTSYRLTMDQCNLMRNSPHFQDC